MSSNTKKQLNKNQTFKRQKIRNARSIRTQTINSKLNNNNDLIDNGNSINLKSFINSRSFEINQLQKSMNLSKNSNSTRIFQSLPRSLRRRTASHNVRRIPKRFRNRAIKEMLKTDQTNITLNKTKKKNNNNKLTSSQFFNARKKIILLRLITKSKSLQLALPDNILNFNNLKSNIKQLKKNLKENYNNNNNNNTSHLNNILGYYDNSTLNKLSPIPKGKRLKYFKRQKLFTWLPTHIWNAKRSHMIKRWGFQLPYSLTQKSFKLTHNLGSNNSKSDGSMIMDTSFIGTMILYHNDPIILINIINKLTLNKATNKKYKFKKYWFQGLCYDFDNDNNNNNNSNIPIGPIDLLWINENKILLRSHPSFYKLLFDKLKLNFNNLNITDCRYAIGSIQLKGAKSLTALSSILRTSSNSSSFNIFKKISNLTDYSVLPERSILAMNVIDPRFLNKPKPLSKINSNISIDDIIEFQNYLNNIDNLTDFNNILNSLIDSNKRTDSYKNVLTLKQISKEKNNIILNRTTSKNNNSLSIPFNENKQSLIPILLVKRNKTNDWTLILPWYWVLPFWYELNKIPRIHHMGLKQQQQLLYENKKLYFPNDYPFTKIGLIENSIFKSQSLSVNWDKKPIGKKINYEKILNIHKNETLLPTLNGEIGDFFSCDWNYLRILKNGINYLLQNGKPLKLIDINKTSQFDENKKNRKINYLNDLLEYYNDFKFNKDLLEISIPIKLSDDNQKEEEEQNLITHDQINKKQIPVIPISCTTIGRGHPKDNARIYRIPKNDLNHWLNYKKGIFNANGKRKHDIKHPLPEITDLIGFVTSATIHLGEGRGTAIGFIHSSNLDEMNKEKYVLIRNVGTNVYRLHSWEQISI